MSEPCFFFPDYDALCKELQSVFESWPQLIIETRTDTPITMSSVLK
jgi:hypothetical protein